MSAFKDLKGFKFGRLLVKEFSRDVKSGNRNRKYWLCECDCGNYSEVRTDGLTEYHRRVRWRINDIDGNQ